MKKECWVFLSVFFLVLISGSFVSAIGTNITLYTLSGHDVSLTVLEPGDQYYSLKTFAGRTGFEGIFSAFYSGNESEIGVAVLLKRDGKKVGYERLDNQYTGGDVVLYYMVNESDAEKNKDSATINDVGSDENVVGDLSNETGVEEEIVADENVSEVILKEDNSSIESTAETGDKTLTGFSISKAGNLIFANNAYIFVSVFILVVLILSFVLYRMKRTPKQVNNSEPPIILYDKEIEDAERKIREAQREIAKVKSQRAYIEKDKKDAEETKKVAEAKKKFEDAKKELEKLEGKINLGNQDNNFNKNSDNKLQ